MNSDSEYEDDDSDLPTTLLATRPHHQSDPTSIASHYNARPNTDPTTRTRSEIIHLRTFHNWVKSVLIREFVSQRNLKVLDIACGKGGDLLKWDKADVSVLTGVDIAKVSIEHAQERYSQLRGSRMKASFLVYDAFNKPFPKDFLPLRSYDAVSCQFAFHYSFSSADSAMCAMRNVVGSLRRGGYFFGVIPNSVEIRHRLKDSQLCPDGRTLENRYYRLEMDLPVTTKFDSPFGIRYTFTLKDAIDACPEYIVPMETFKSMLKQLGMEFILEAPLPEFFETFSQVPEYEQLMHRMGIVEGDSLAMSPEEVEVAALYTAFSFRKL